jgi:protein-L-isoaspartate(D-aspartate) O-methyltransferase
VARETELLEVTNEDRVLEIGAGSGYQTAVLSYVAGRVFAIERLSELAREAAARLRELRIFNATVKWFDGTVGWNEFAPYRAILVAAASPDIPPLVKNCGQRSPGDSGGDEKTQRLIRVTRTAEGTTTEDCGGCQFVNSSADGWER